MILTDTLRDDQAELYQRTVKRLEATGKHTHLAQIIALAEEIEGYRESIHNLQNACDHRGKRIEFLERARDQNVAMIEKLQQELAERVTLQDALADKATKFQEENEKNRRIMDNMYNALDDCKQIIKRLQNEAAESRPGWISVAERLPNKPCACLVVAGIQVTMATWLPEENFWRALPHGYIFGPGYITHWMDLPELPEEVKA